MSEYLGILIFFVVALGVGFVFTVANSILGPKTKEKMEDYPYECGVPLYDPEARGTFKQGYYLLGLLLILFDIEVAFCSLGRSSLRTLAYTGSLKRFCS